MPDPISIHDASEARERARSSALHAYGILDTPREAEFDDLARIAADVCGTPIAVVNLVDTHRQFFKAEVGLGVRETPLETSFCGHAILADDFMMVPDAMHDPRFVGNPLVTGEAGLRFYAGALLKTSEGLPIGTMCVLGYEPKTLDPAQIRTLKLLARQAMTQMELRRALQRSRLREAHHRQVFDSVTDYAIVTLDLDGNVTGWNSGAEQLLGWREDEMLGGPVDIFFTPSDRAAAVPEQEMRAAREKGHGSDERWHVRKDGSRFFALGEMMPLQSDAGVQVGYVKVFRDRTRERRRSDRLAFVGQISAALLTALDPAGAMLPILEKAAPTIGFERSFVYDIMPDRQYLSLTHSVGADEWTKAFLKHVPVDVPLCGIVAQTGQPLVLSHLQDDLHPRYAIAREAGLHSFAGFPIRTANQTAGVISFASSEILSFDDESLAFYETVARFLSLARQRVDRETSLRIAEERARLAQEAGRIGTFEADVVSGMMTVSPQFCRLFGMPIQPTCSASALEVLVLSDDDVIGSDGSVSMLGGAAAEVEYQIRRADDGHVRWIARRAEFVRNDEGQMRAMFGTVHDITDRKRRQSQQSALLELGARFRDVAGKGEILRMTSETLGRTLGASRAGYAQIDPRSGRFAVEEDWTASGILSLRGHQPSSAWGVTVDHMSGGQVLAIDDTFEQAPHGVHTDGADRSRMRAQIVVPLLERGALVGMLYAHQADRRTWTRDEIDFATGVADHAYAALSKVRAEAEQTVLNEEISHRLKNTLAMVQAIATQTLRTVPEREPVHALTQRIQALSKAHDVLLQKKWSAASVSDIVRSSLATFDQPDRFEISGPALEFGPKAALALSLLLHELGTNALKYGALSNAAGRVTVSWHVDAALSEPDIVLAWRETGGPAVSAPPQRKGFGSRLIQAGLMGTGGVLLTFDPSGFTSEMRAPLSQIQQG